MRAYHVKLYPSRYWQVSFKAVLDCGGMSVNGGGPAEAAVKVA